MTSSHLHSAYRRNAQAVARKRLVRKASNEDELQRAREDFSFFCEYIDEKKKPAKHHKEWHRHFVTEEDSACLLRIAGPNIDLLAPRGPLAVSMPVATPNGWVPIGELQLGDLVFSEKGEVTEVVNISDYPETKTWKVIFTDGSFVECDDHHLWKVRRMGTDAKGEWRVMSLYEMRTQKTVGMKGNGRGNSPVRRITETCKEGERPWLDSRDYPRYQIPITDPVQYPETDLPLDPYLLGALIGDGSISHGNVVLTSADQEVIDRCAAALPEDYSFKNLGRYGYRISHVNGNQRPRDKNTVKEILEELGVYGKTSAYKFIPKQYLFASIEDREALLQGLLDTDGTVSSTGSVSFCTTSKQLLEDVIELVQSLGGIATKRTPQLNTYTTSTGEKVRTTTPSYTLGIKLHVSIKPFHLTRKARLYAPLKKYPPYRNIADIQPAGTEKVRCIEVAAKEHTFLTKDYICTHNSAKSTSLGLFTAWAIGIHTMAKKPLQILYISYTLEIARAKSATIKRIIESKRYQEVFPCVKILKNVNSNEYWSIDYKFAGIEATGDEQFTLCAAGLKGSVTSKRSHLCLTGDTLVKTNIGDVPISAIYEHPERYQVAVRNSETDHIDWSRVGAVTRRTAKGIVQITTASGNKISATPEHPFVTQDGGQKRAGDIGEGEILVGVSCGQQNSKLPFLRRTKEKNTTYLRGLLQNNLEVSSSTNLPSMRGPVLCNVQEPGSSVVQETGGNLLRSQLCGSSKEDSFGKELQVLQHTISSTESQNSVLFKDLRGQASFFPYAENGKQQLSSRLFQQRLSKDKAAYFGAGQFYMCGVQYKGAEVAVKRRKLSNESLCSPHRSHENKQYPSKFNHIVSPVPCSTSPGDGQGWAPEPVSRVEFFSDREEFVYDLEVDHKDHNFIANGLNVLNCLLDDVVKSASDIANPDIRKMMQDNWNAVISPTMFEGGRAICLGTRFRHDDIHATTFNAQNNWTQIVLSAIQSNPETAEEESYWPEMWSLEYLKEKKRQAPIAFSFQYMNQIVRQSELSLSPELIVKAEIATEFDTLAVGVDLSAGIKEKNDYTVMVLGGRIGDQIHVIDYRRLRVMGNLEKLDALKELLHDWSVIGKDANDLYFPTYSTCDIYSEAVQYQASLEADFKRVCLNNEGLYNLNWHPVKGFRADKLARFRGCMGLFEDRKIIFNRYRNFTALFEELTNFGVSSHDDCVDALVWLINGLMRKGKLQVDF